MVDKYSETLKEDLSEYIETLIELKHGKKIGAEIKICWDSIDIDTIMCLSKEQLKYIECIYMDKEEILLNSTQKEFIKNLENMNVNILDVPKYYYKEIL